MRRTDKTRLFFQFFAAIFMAVALLGSPVLMASALAQTQDTPYVVRDVKVDTIAASAVKAREKAFGEAQLKAFDVLAGRFMAAEDLAQFQKPDARVIAGLVQDFEVVSEQLSTKRYVGTYIFRFKESATARFFGHGPVSGYGDASIPTGYSSGLLVLPFYQEGDGQYLWDAKNIWLQAWKRNSGDVIIPTGDVSDLMDIQNGQALSYNPAALKRMKKRYGASDAVIALASLQPATPAQPLKVQLYRTDVKKPELGSTITIQAQGITTPDQILDTAVLETLAALRDNWKTEALPPTTLHANMPGTTPMATATLPSEQPGYDPSMPRALQGALQGAGQGAEQQANPPTSYTAAVSDYRTSVRFTDMAQWISMRRNLNGINGLSGVKIISLNRTEAVVDITYQGNADALKSNLAARGMAFNMAANGYILTATPQLQ